MRLGVDVDGVILDSVPLYRTAFEKRGYTTTDESIFPFNKAYGTDAKTTEEICKEVEQLTDIPLIPGAQILNKIVNLPHIESPIHFVSSRSLDSWDATYDALTRHFPLPFDFDLFCEVDKGWYCNEYELDFFVEDGPPHIRDIFWNSTTKIYILDKPYNQQFNFPETFKVLRVKNWDEVLIDLQREGYREAVK